MIFFFLIKISYSEFINAILEIHFFIYFLEKKINPQKNALFYNVTNFMVLDLAKYFSIQYLTVMICENKVNF